MRKNLSERLQDSLLALWATVVTVTFAAIYLVAFIAPDEADWAEELRDAGRSVYIIVLLLCLFKAAFGLMRRITGKDDCLEDEQTESSSAENLAGDGC